MFEPPAQDDTPAPGARRADPWAEQQRRSAEHRAARRRRRLLVSVAAVAAVVVVGGLVALVLRADADVDDETGSAPTDSPMSASATSPGTVADDEPSPATTVAAEDLIGIAESWLLDRGDGVYDWGVVLRTPDGAPRRSGVEVDVRLTSGSGQPADAEQVTLDGVGSAFPGVVVGRLVDPERVPARLEFDVRVGVESDAPALGELLDLRALERDGDVLSGRVRVVGAEAIEDVGVVFVWRDGGGEVVAAVPLDVERVRPGVDARFELDLGDEAVPDGPPDDAFWTT